MPTTKPKNKKAVVVKSGGRVSIKQGKAKEKPEKQTLDVLFEGLKIEISPRVFTEWERMQNERKTYISDLRESSIQATVKWSACINSHITLSKEKAELDRAIYFGDIKAAKRNAVKLARMNSLSHLVDEEAKLLARINHTDAKLLMNWMDGPNGLCLAWFSRDALACLFEYAGIESRADDRPDSLRSSRKRLGLAGLKRPIISVRNIKRTESGILIE